MPARPALPDRGLGLVGRRGLQFWLDLVIGGALTCVPLLMMLALPRNPEGQIASVLLGTLVLVVALGVGLGLNVWYWVWWPTARGGRTLGMVLLGLRVLRRDGGPVTRSQMGLRWLMLLVDALLFGLVGLCVILVTPLRQRFGDLFADTVVVHESGR